MKDALQGWVHAFELSHLCNHCKNCVHEHKMSACEYGQKQFPHAQKCVRHEPEDMDE
jgi:hypothetical protein